MATFECGLCGKVSHGMPCDCHRLDYYRDQRQVAIDGLHSLLNVVNEAMPEVGDEPEMDAMFERAMFQAFFALRAIVFRINVRQGSK